MSKDSNNKQTTAGKDSKNDIHVAKINLVGVLATAIFGFLGVAIVAYFGFLRNPSDSDVTPVVGNEVVAEQSNSNSVSDEETNEQVLDAASNLEYSILVDTYHGKLPFEFRGKDGSILQNKGYIFEEAIEPFTVDYLTNYDGLIIWFAQNKDDKSEFSSEEIRAVRDYISQGGSVFLIGLGWVWNSESYGNLPIEDYPLNIIADGSGITFTEHWITELAGGNQSEVPYVFRQSFMAKHPITENVNNIAASKSAPGILDIDNESPAIALIWGDDTVLSNGDGEANSVILAASTLGEGRIVALQHVSYAIEFVDKYEDHNYSPDDYDNSQLLENILSWLVGG